MFEAISLIAVGYHYFLINWSIISTNLTIVIHVPSS